ncbi:hypothetical protein LXH09_37205 [Streptomyces sp. CS7]|uniref:hypothetical protein n=1 Tax=Streptomyces sp. CS-7 TaxID=2906769 RepID=UPI0021B172A3|nr:hypothetical protein [Streptomyces sp. CS-7]MCT6782263.1 hypothetical protein [Streptomyces sp. CS-7]
MLVYSDRHGWMVSWAAPGSGARRRAGRQRIAVDADEEVPTWTGVGGEGHAGEMNDEGGAGEGVRRAEKVALYMETLRARMDAEQFAALAGAVHQAAHLLAQGREGSIGSDEDSSLFTPEMHRELATVLAILVSGEMEHAIVELPGDGGSFAVMDADADETAVQEMREHVERLTAEREALDSELGGIARASGLDAD